MTRLSVFTLLLLFNACLTRESRQSEAIKAVEEIANQQRLTLDTAFKSTPVMTNTILESRMSLTADSSQQAGSDITDDRLSSKITPLGMRLIFIGLGGALILGVGFFAWRMMSTTAIGQGIKLVDQELSRRISALRLRREQVTESDRAAINAEIAELEADRGKLSRKQ